MDSGVSMMEVNPAQIEVLQSLMQLANEDPNQTKTIEIKSSEETVHTNGQAVAGDAENEMVTIVPMEDVQTAVEECGDDKMVTYIAIDEMGNRIPLPDDVVTFVSVDDDGNAVHLQGDELTPEQLHMIQVGMGLDKTQADGEKIEGFPDGLEAIEVYKCDQCRQVFTERGHWDAHNCPGGPADDGYPQPLTIELEQTSVEPHQQMMVVKQEPEDDTNLECNLCRRTFAIRDNWEQHMMSHVDKIEPRPNSLLEQKQLSIVDSGVNAIVLSPKTGDVEYRCDACGKRYQQKSDLEKHLVTHIVDKFYECPICNNAFATKFSLRKHVINHLKGKGKPFKCTLCEKAFNQKVNLRAHMSIHTGIKDFKCDICGKEFSLRGNLNKHVRIHTEERPFKCDICERAFKVKEYLMQHRLTHTTELPYMCGLCGRRFKLQEYVDRHMLKCDGTKTSTCEQCGMTYQSRGDLSRHIDERHPELKPYACSICGKRFKLKTYVQQHEPCHNDVRNWQCEICQKEFKCRNSLRQHLLWHKRQDANEKFLCNICGKEIQYALNMKRHMLIHTGNMPFPCKVCGRGFPDTSHLRRHMMRHNNDRPHSCPICNKRFFTATHLKRHSERHGSAKTQFICKICGKGFLTEEKMTRHFETHYGAVKGRFKCKYCDKACNKRSDLSRHILIHTGEKPYKCDICFLNFRTSTHRKRHQLTHTTEKPFKCDICGKAFKTRDVLKKHQTIHVEGKSGWKRYCLTCGKAFKLLSQLELHVKNNCQDGEEETPKRPYRMRKEKMATPTTAEEVHEDTQIHKCEKCSRTFSSEDHLKRHASTHREDEGGFLQDDDLDETYEFECLQCSKQFKDAESLDKHKAYCKVKPLEAKTVNYINKKTPKNSPLDCVLCSKSFKRTLSMKQHTILTHTAKDFTKAGVDLPRDILACKDCHQLFTMFNSLRKHRLTTHAAKKLEDPVEEEDSSMCTYCGEMFKESTNLVKHLLAKHYNSGENSADSAPAIETDVAISAKIKETKVSAPAERRESLEDDDGSDYSYRCEVCSQGFISHARWQAHIVTHPEIKLHRCEECPKFFRHLKYLEKHIQVKHLNSDGKLSRAVFKCDDCEEKFLSRVLLKQHRQKEHGEVESPTKSPRVNKSPFGCNACAEVMEDTPSLLEHVKATHKELAYPCGICGRGYSREQALKQHTTLKHPGVYTPKGPTDSPSDRAFICVHCRKGFRTESQLKRHMPTHREEDADFVSPVKMEVVETPSKKGGDRGDGDAENTKSPSVSVEKLPLCNICGEWFVNKNLLEEHLLTTHADIIDSSKLDMDEDDEEEVRPKFVCVYCDKTFSSQFSLTRHDQKWCPVKKKKAAKLNSISDEFHCGECEASFMTESQLDDHKQCHKKVSNVEPFACGTCGEIFPKQAALRKHELSHESKDTEISKPRVTRQNSKEAESPVVGTNRCKICDISFTTASEVQAHMTEEHQKVKLETSSAVFTPTGEKIQKCKVCDGWFADLQKHVASAHKELNVTTPLIVTDDCVCEICDEEFDSSSLLQTHMCTSHNDAEESTKQEEPMEEEPMEEEPEADDVPLNVTNTCTNCNDMFHTLADWFTHKLNDCGPGMPQCIICCRFFKATPNLRLHYLRVHNVRRANELYDQALKRLASEQSFCQDDRMSCMYCPKHFKAYAKLKEHIIDHKAQDNAFKKSAQKSKNVPNNSVSSEPMDTSENDQSIENHASFENAEGETLLTADQASLELPETSVGDKTNDISEADSMDATVDDSGDNVTKINSKKTSPVKNTPKKQANTPSTRSSRSAAKSSTKGSPSKQDEKQYVCYVCNRRCATPWSLKQHMDVHGVKPITEQSFAQTLDLFHTGKAPFKCDVCGRTFSKSSQLGRHKATHKS